MSDWASANGPESEYDLGQNYLYEISDTIERMRREILGERPDANTVAMHPEDWHKVQRAILHDVELPPTQMLFGMNVILSTHVPMGEVMFVDRPDIALDSFIKPRPASIQPVFTMPGGYLYRLQVKVDGGPWVTLDPGVPTVVGWRPAFQSWQVALILAVIMIVLTIIVSIGRIG